MSVCSLTSGLQSTPRPTDPVPESEEAWASAGADPADPGGWFIQLLERRQTPCWLVASDGGLVGSNHLARAMLPPNAPARHLSDLLTSSDGEGAIEASLQQPDRSLWLPLSIFVPSGEVRSGMLTIGRLASTPFGPLRVASFEPDGSAAWQQPVPGTGTAPHPAQPGAGAADAPAPAEVIATAFATLGHEIRTPLNAVLGFTELLRRDLASSSDPLRSRWLHHLQRIADAGTHLLGMSDDLLDPSSARRSGPTPTGATGATPVPLSALFDASVSLTQDRFIHHQVRLILEPDGRQLRVRADLRRCTQVLCNLLTNAAKYTPAGGRATLSARRVAGVVRIAVVDNGPGIDATGQARLFNAYERLGVSDERVEGHGLGLFVSHQLVTAMNGRIGCRSEPGAGAEFWFELPAA